MLIEESNIRAMDCYPDGIRYDFDIPSRLGVKGAGLVDRDDEKPVGLTSPYQIWQEAWQFWYNAVIQNRRLCTNGLLNIPLRCPSSMFVIAWPQISKG